MEENKRIENVITVDNTSKRPLGASTYGSLTPPEGPTAEGTTIVYLYEQPPFDLLENYYYDFGKEEFVKATDKPHSYVVWDPATLGWAVNNEAYMDAVMMQRTRLLYLTDWCFVGDVTLEPADLTLVTSYRQELRDFPSTITDFDKPVEDQNWPEVPPFLVSSSTTRMIFNGLI